MGTLNPATPSRAGGCTTIFGGCMADCKGMFICDFCDVEMTWLETQLACEQGEFRYCLSNHPQPEDDKEETP